MANMQEQLAETPAQRTGEMGTSAAPRATVGADNTPTPPVGTPRPQI
jgi:hypothetical protein